MSIVCVCSVRKQQNGLSPVELCQTGMQSILIKLYCVYYTHTDTHKVLYVMKQQNEWCGVSSVNLSVRVQWVLQKKKQHKKYNVCIVCPVSVSFF